ncbi:exported hypothetical protein [Paraburkholderia piptadeniae]|uniref:Uncharacterized protein n=1 Tax=Paraburkholderia piptadeniae TaxID=1701573 RepID=A0A1N7RPK3_9BURK|nr:exported hypothetical protein [Paraburkholderia piptadeniae]
MAKYMRKENLGRKFSHAVCLDSLLIRMTAANAHPAESPKGTVHFFPSLPLYRHGKENVPPDPPAGS